MSNLLARQDLIRGTFLARRVLSRPRGLMSKWVISCHRLKGFMEDDITNKLLKFVENTDIKKF